MNFYRMLNIKTALVLASAVGALVSGTMAPGAQAKTGGVGWQGSFTYTVPTGTPRGFFTYPCPTNLVARSGAFFPNPTLQDLGINLGVNAPRIDVNSYASWGFEYNIPGGSPSGATIQFDVYCTKAPI